MKTRSLSLLVCSLILTGTARAELKVIGTENHHMVVRTENVIDAISFNKDGRRAFLPLGNECWRPGWYYIEDLAEHSAWERDWILRNSITGEVTILKLKKDVNSAGDGRRTSADEAYSPDPSSIYEVVLPCPIDVIISQLNLRPARAGSPG
jgi:hypothetical protein